MAGRKGCLNYTQHANLLLSVVLASIARLVLFLIYKDSQNPTLAILFGHLASSVEVCLAIIAACLPSCAPLLKRMIGSLITTVRSLGQGNTEDSKKGTLVTIGHKHSRTAIISRTHRDNDLEGSFERLDDNGSLQGSTDDLYINGGTEGVISTVWSGVMESKFLCITYDSAR